MKRKLELRRDGGTYYAHDVEYPYIGHPQSFGTKSIAEAYIAAWYGMTLNEYYEAKNKLSRMAKAAGRKKL